MRLSLTSYHRSFEAPGAPVVWGVRVDDVGKVGIQSLAAQVVQLAETDDALNVLAVELHGPGAVWDEATLIECTRRTLQLAADVSLAVAKPPIGA